MQDWDWKDGQWKLRRWYRGMTTEDRYLYRSRKDEGVKKGYEKEDEEDLDVLL